MTARAGRLKYQVEIQSPVDTPDGAGGQVRLWEPVITRRAGQELKGSRIFHALQQRYHQLSHVFRLRDIEIQPQYRLFFEGVAHRIIGIETQYRETLVITESEQRTKTYGH